MNAYQRLATDAPTPPTPPTFHHSTSAGFSGQRLVLEGKIDNLGSQSPYEACEYTASPLTLSCGVDENAFCSRLFTDNCRRFQPSIPFDAAHAMCAAA